MAQQPARICILGGGFGGLYTALRLNQLPWANQERPEIVLVEQRDRFLFSPLLYELLTGELQSWEVAPPYTELLANTDIHFCQQPVVGINLEERAVYTQDGRPLNYDRLVLALGGETPLDFVPGAVEHAIPFRQLDDVYRVEERLRHLEASTTDKIRVAIVGAGYSGVELACKLADRLGDRGRVRLIEQSDQILRTSPEFNREVAQAALQARQIWVDLETTVESLGTESISLVYKNQVDTIPVDLVLWTVGTRMHPLVKDLPLKQNQRGQLITTSTLQVMDQSKIFALGDLAECHDAAGQLVPNTAQAAFQQADYVSWNVWATLTGRPLLPFHYYHWGELMTLGVDQATLSGLGINLEGSLAQIVRRLAYLYRMPTWEHQVKVGLNWLMRPIADFLTPLS